MNLVHWTLLVGLTAPAALGQTIYKCPPATPGSPPVIQQMPCSPTGGGETITVHAPKTSTGTNDAAEATARIKAYSDSLNDQWRTQKENNDRPSKTDSLAQEIESVKRSELARDCYDLGKRIRYIERLESQGSHVREGSVMDEDSKAAIEQYEKNCGAWK